MKKIGEKIVLHVEGMTCNNCASGIRTHLEKNFIENVNVNFPLSEVSCNEDETSNKKHIISLIEDIGYKVKNKNNEEKKFSKVEMLFFISLLFTTPLFSHMFLDHSNILYDPFIQLGLCLPVYFIGLIYFGKSAFNSLKTGVPNMDVLIFIGSSAAFFYSIYGWWLFYGTNEVHNYMFFETSATIITLVLLGNVLEHRSVKQTTTALKDLYKIKNTLAKKICDDKIVDVKFEDIILGDILIVNSGDIIPTDGTIIWGDCSIDESMITGESLPVVKKNNNMVIGGTTLLSGSIKIKALKVGNNTILSQIIELVKNAQKDQPEIQKLGDKVSAIFVPIVISISTLTFLIGHFYFLIDFQDALLRSIAVLVISCPCAMGLATPTAVMVGIGRAAKNGILIKGGDTLEKLAYIKNIVFDKTGTLTTGEFEVSELNIINGDEKEIKNIIYNLELNSSHPIASSLCNAFAKYNEPLELSQIIEKKGISISAIINNEQYTIGSSKIITLDNKDDLCLLKKNNKYATLIL
jgi:Cu+-exporting ATPase